MPREDLLEQRKSQLLELTETFCDEKLDHEHKELTTKAVNSLCRKDFFQGENDNLNEWAAGIIHAIGSVNLLFDKSFDPYISKEEIVNYFQTDIDTTEEKAATIKDLLKLNVFDPNFSAHISDEDNPLKDMVSIDGIYISLELLPSYLRTKLREVKRDGYMVEFRSDEV
ncbi:MAG: DUF6398 domain-containing protein [Bacteroidales bacterium]